MIDWLCENWTALTRASGRLAAGRKIYLRPVDVVGSLRSRYPYRRATSTARRPREVEEHPGRGLQADHASRLAPGEACVRSALSHRCARRSPPLHALVGFISPMDPMWQSTLNEMDKELVSDSLVYRYNPEASPDGLEGSEGTFSICTFWYVDALARSGRLEDARLTFDKMMTYANHLGLFSEEIGPSGEQLGTSPGVQSSLADHRGREPRLPARPRRRYDEAGAGVRRGEREVGAHLTPNPLSLRGEGELPYR